MKRLGESKGYSVRVGLTNCHDEQTCVLDSNVVGIDSYFCLSAVLASSSHDNDSTVADRYRSGQLG